MAALPWDFAVLCHQHSRTLSRGIWRGDNPLDFSIPVFLIQIALATSVTGFVHFLVKPFGQCSYVSHMIGGFLLGPSVLGLSDIARSYLFSTESAYAYETVEIFGCMLYLFIAGVQIDLSMLRRTGTKAFIIGFSAFLLPLMCTTLTWFIIRTFVHIDPQLAQMLPFVAMCESYSSTQVIGTLLSELDLLNSELGRLTVASSTVTFMCSWFAGFMTLSIKQGSSTGLAGGTTGIFLSTAIAAVLIISMKPMLVWVLRNTKQEPHDGTTKEFHVLVILLMAILSGLFGELIGQHYIFGPMLLGLIIPPGPPIGSMIKEKLETFILKVTLPIYFVGSAARASAHGIRSGTFWALEPIIIIGCIGKLFGTYFSCLYYGMPSRDCFLAGLIMSSQGIVDLQYFRHAVQLELITNEVYSVMAISTVVQSGIISPLVKSLYRPSSRYLGYKARTIQFSRPKSELRILVCIYKEANVPTVIDLLEASNPTRESPLCVYLLHLLELQGLANPVFVAHQRRKSHSSIYNRSNHIVNAFRHFEQQNQGIATVNPFTAITPYATMHDDICNLALDKKASLVIVPFHRQRNFDGLIDITHRIRTVNCNVLDMVPCSVGILVDDPDNNQSNAANCILGSKSLYRVGVVFLGGADDRETLAYASRMAEHPNISLTVVRFVTEEDKVTRSFEKRLDGNSVNEFRLNYMGNERVVFREEVVKDSVGTIRVIRALEGSYDLLMVGRRHRMDTPLVSGLVDWNDFPELGHIGDILATSNTRKGSILVVQQPVFVSEDLPGSPSTRGQVGYGV